MYFYVADERPAAMHHDNAREQTLPSRIGIFTLSFIIPMLILLKNCEPLNLCSYFVVVKIIWDLLSEFLIHVSLRFCNYIFVR